MKEQITKTDKFKQLNNSNKILWLLYDDPGLNIKELSKRCYPITLVTSVTSVTSDPHPLSQEKKSNQSNQSNQSNKVTTKKAYSLVKAYLSKFKKKNYIQVDESLKPYKYSLTEKGRIQVKEEYTKYQEELLKVIKRERQKDWITDTGNIIEDYLNYNKSEVLKEIHENKHYYKINFKVLCEFDPELCNDLLDRFEDTYFLFKSVFLKLFDDLIQNKEDFGFVFYNMIESNDTPITKLRSSHIGKLISVVGEVKSRSFSCIKTTSIRFECPACGNIINIPQLNQKETKPSRCVCGRMKNFRRLSSKDIDFLRLSLSDLYENLDYGDVPEEINILLEHDFYSYSKINEGDKIRIHGIVKLVPEYEGLNIKEKVVQAFGLEFLDNDYNKVFITEQDEKDFEEIKKDIFKWHNDLFFRDIKGINFQKKISLLSFYGNLDVLFVGDPGTCKSELLTRLINHCVKGKWADCQNARAPGVIGAVDKNKFTGKSNIVGGILRPMHPNGVVCLDELNRDENQSIQQAVMTIMSRRRLNINKGGINFDCPCDINILATANPTYDKLDTHQMIWRHFSIRGALWDRFNLVVYCNDKINYNDYDTCFDLIKRRIESKNEKKDPKKLLLFKKYQIKSKLTKVKIERKHITKLVTIIQEIYLKLNPQGSGRLIQIPEKLLVAVCKMNHREKPIDADFKFITELIENLHTQKLLFEDNK